MFYVLGTPAIVNIIVTLVLAVLTLVPTHYVHPARVKRFRTLNIAAVALWFLATCWLVAIYPERPLSTVAVIVVCGGWVLLAGVCVRFVVQSWSRNPLRRQTQSQPAPTIPSCLAETTVE